MYGMKPLVWAILMGAGIASITTQVFADNMSVPSGWYLEGNIGGSHLSGKSYPGNSSTSGLAGSVDVGYKFMPYLGTEIGYTHYANTTIKNSAGTKAATDRFYSYDIA